MHRAHKRAVAAILKHIQIHALAPQNQPLAHLHLGNYLHSVATNGHAAHRQRKTTVRRATARNSRAVLLLPVNIKRHNLCARTAHGKRNSHRLARTIATFGYRVRKVVTARQCQRHHLHAQIALLRLRLSG